MNKSKTTPKSLGIIINDAIVSIHGGQEEVFNVSANILKECETIIGMKIIKAKEEERRIIAMDIHDGPAQSIASLVIKTEIIEKQLNKGNEKISDEIKETKLQLIDILKELKSIMYDLRPTSLDDIGLIATIQSLAADLSYKYNINFKINILSDYIISNSIIKLVIYRIIQEIFNNIVKHSKANKVMVNIDVKMNIINISIIDDGIGFDLDKLIKENNSLFGLSSIKERAEMANGTLIVKSAVGKGTSIKFSIPNEEALND